MKSFRIAVFASGEGTNFQALANAVRTGALQATIELLVCDKPGARVVQRAEAEGISCHTFIPKEYASKEAYEQEIANILDNRGVDLIVLAGYMRLLSPILVERYEGRIINIHPSLLPAFPGKDAVGQAVRLRCAVDGSDGAFRGWRYGYWADHCSGACNSTSR